MDPRRDEFSDSVEENVRDIIYHVYCTSVLYLRLMSGHTLSIQPYRDGFERLCDAVYTWRAGAVCR